MLLIVEKRLDKIIFISSILFFLQGHESAMYAVFVCVCVRACVRVCVFSNLTLTPVRGIKAVLWEIKSIIF